MEKTDGKYTVKDLLTALDNQRLCRVQDILEEQSISLSEWVLDLGVTPLHLAVGSGTEGFAACVCHDMLRCGANANAASADGMTPVHVAAAWGRPTVLHLLLLHGGDPWKQDEEGRNAFNFAFETRAWGIVELLHSLQFIPNPSSPQCCAVPASPLQHNDVHNESNESISSKSDQSSQTYSSNEALNVHNVTFCIERHGVSVVTEDYVHERPKLNETFITAHTIIGKPKEIVVPSGKALSPKPDDCCFKKPATPPKLDIIPRAPKEERKTTGRRLTFTIDTPKKDEISAAKENKSARIDLFEELKAAVNRRAMRMSGVETLPSSSFSDYCNSTRDDDSINASTRSSTVDLNKAIASESQLSDVKSEFYGSPKSSSLRVELKHTNPIHGESDDVDDAYLQYALITESRFSGEMQYCDDIDTSTSYHSLDNSVASSGGFQSCDSPPSQEMNGGEKNVEDIRRELTEFGVNPGPITPTTRAVYQRLLTRLRRQGPAVPPNSPATPVSAPLPSPAAAACTSPGPIYFPTSYSCELENALNGNYSAELGASLEDKLRGEYDGSHRGRTCFNYLLLDQRVTQDLPQRVRSGFVDPVLATRQFVSAVFYVGKGTASRPLEHLKEAKLAWQYNKEGKNPKEAKILDIWRSGQGVICLRVFQDISNEEALTREAAMIEAMRRQNLCNLQPGNFFGTVAHWSAENKKRLGVYLLFTAKDIFLQTGERSFRPSDL